MDTELTLANVRTYVVEHLTTEIKDQFPHVNVQPVVTTDSGKEVHFIDISLGDGVMLAIDFNEPEQKAFRLLSIVAPEHFKSTDPRIYNYNLTASNIQIIEANPISVGGFLITAIVNRSVRGLMNLESSAEGMVWHAKQAILKRNESPSVAADE